MFKKAKLYSLLAVIVASTVVGLFGASEVSAQSAEVQAVWAEGGRGRTIVYGSEICTAIPGFVEGDFKNSDGSDFGFDDKSIFTCTELQGRYFSMILFRTKNISETQITSAWYTIFTAVPSTMSGRYMWNAESKITFNPGVDVEYGEDEPDPWTLAPNVPPGDTATWSRSHPPGDPLSQLNYAGMTFTTMNMQLTEVLQAAGIPSDAFAYAAPQTIDGAGNKLDHFMYFTSSTDLTNATYVVLRRDASGENAITSQKDNIAVSIAAPDDKDGNGEGASRCQIKGIGWLFCPIILFLAEVTDNSYAILNHTFLKLEPIVLPGAESNENSMRLHTSWRAMRDFANVVFIIGFLVIVFSQITNIGVSNYGIKRLLPKIIIAAILVNVSYYICAIAVDLSNILGNSLRGVLMSVGTESSGAGPLSFTISPDGMSGEGYGVTDWQTLANVVMGMAGGALAAAGVGIAVYAFLPVFLPLVLSAAIAVLTVVIALTIRQALVVILIVVSPLAFVALLLPNTESYFQKWKSLFVAMLLVYPIISVIFGASALAAKILMATNDFPTQLVGAGVSIIPLFITPIVMKASGGLLNRWVGLVNNPNRGPIDGLKKGAENRSKRWESRRKMNALGKSPGRGARVFGGRYRRAAKGAAITSSLEAGAKRSESKYISDEAQTNNDFQKDLAGTTRVPLVGGKTVPGWVPKAGGKTIPEDIIEADPEAIQRALAGAIHVEAKLEAEDISAARAIITKLDLSKDQIEQLSFGNNATDARGSVVLANTPNSALQTAAIHEQFKAGDVDYTDKLVAKSGSMDTPQRQAVASGMSEMSNRVVYYGNAAQEEAGKGNIKSDADIDRIAAKNYIETGKTASSGVLTGNDKKALQRIAKLGSTGSYVASSGATVTIDPDSIAAMKVAAADTLANPNVPQPSDEIRHRIQAVAIGLDYPSYEHAVKTGGASPPPPRPR